MGHYSDLRSIPSPRQIIRHVEPLIELFPQFNRSYEPGAFLEGAWHRRFTPGDQFSLVSPFDAFVFAGPFQEFSRGILPGSAPLSDYHVTIRIDKPAIGH